jgi:hypothetical protein
VTARKAIRRARRDRRVRTPRTAWWVFLAAIAIALAAFITATLRH